MWAFSFTRPSRPCASRCRTRNWPDLKARRVMNENFDDPKLTAYALGELEGKERTEVENLLANNPEARQWVEEVRGTATRLENELCVGESPQLNSAQLGAVEAELALR